MALNKTKLFLISLTLALAVGGGGWLWNVTQEDCCAPDPLSMNCGVGGPRMVGVMTSLPLFWPVGTEVKEIASGIVETPWLFSAMGGLQCNGLVPLDTLSPIPGLTPDDPETDPLRDLERVAVIQPRGLSPADNVALDDWVRRGGRLLLVLDPLLTGHYNLPLGDPRLPNLSALIPPVVERWGLEVVFDETQVRERDVAMPFHTEPFELAMAGEVRTIHAQHDCEIGGNGVIAQCFVGKGRITLLADAAIFEGDESDPQRVEAIQSVMGYAWQ